MIFVKRFILDVWQGSEYASATYATISIWRLPIESLMFLTYSTLLIVVQIAEAYSEPCETSKMN